MPREALAELSELIRSHPAFLRASRRYASEYVQWRERLGILNRVIANAARLRILENLIYLHAVRFDGQRRSGASFERIAELSGFTDDIGTRAVRTMLRLAQIGGLVVTARDPDDGRLRVYQPTEALLEHAREYVVIILRPLDAIFPHLHVRERLESEPGYYFEVISAMGRIYLEMGLKSPRTPDPFRDLMRLEGAAPILITVIDCHFNGRDIPAAPELSRRFLVSQSQARAVLKAAAAQGLIRTGPRGRLLDAEPLARMQFGAFARFLAFAARHGFGIEPPRVA